MSRTVNQAVTDLMAELGAACGAEQGQLHTAMGKSLTMSMVIVNPAALQRSPGEVCGGKVYIKLGGEAQPEAARVLDHIIGNAFKKTGIPEVSGCRRQITRDANYTGRAVIFEIPEEKTSRFISEVDKMVQRIVTSTRLKHECHNGVKFSLETINRIEGAKPFVQLEMPDDIHQKPYFVLHIEGVPDALADALAPLLKKDGKEDFPRSDARGDRAGGGSFVGGRDVDIALNQEYTNPALDTIQAYVNIMNKRVKKLPPGQPRFPG
jgi:hypothetical protein